MLASRRFTVICAPRRRHSAERMRLPGTIACVIRMWNSPGSIGDEVAAVAAAAMSKPLASHRIASHSCVIHRRRLLCADLRRIQV